MTGPSGSVASYRERAPRALPDALGVELWCSAHGAAARSRSAAPAVIADGRSDIGRPLLVAWARTWCVESPERERRQVVDYFLSQSPEGTTVEHAEKIAIERVYGIAHEVWEVHASDGRWWVITNPTNLY